MAFPMLAGILQASLGILASYILWTLYLSPLRHVPGPFLARFTDLWRLCSTLNRQTEVTQRKLHDRYGPVVRLGPNMVTVSDPTMISEIYSRKNILIKGDFYKVWDFNYNGRRVDNTFTTRNEQKNTQFLRPVTKFYSMSSLLKVEPRIDDTIKCFLDQLHNRFAKPDRPCDIDNWLHYCAWDVIGDISFSWRLGFMEQGKDIFNILSINQSILDYASVVGMMPWLDLCLERNPIMRFGVPSSGSLLKFVVDRIIARQSGKDGHDPSAPDMLDGFIEAQENSAPEVKANALISYVATNVQAGSDTVAGELRSIIYHLCKNPEAYEKLRNELDTKEVSAPVSWAKCQELPYLCACVSEGFRILPSVGLPLERRVGQGGMAVSDGKNQVFLPPGTLVGMNPYVVNRDRDVYGADADQFRPERWLQGADEPQAAYQLRLSRMKATDMTFGAGKRICLGRNLALIECHKIVASLLRTFDVELVNPSKEWKTHNAWMIRQSAMDVRLKRRT